MSNSQTTITFFFVKVCWYCSSNFEDVVISTLVKNFFDVKETVIRENFFVQIGCCNYFKGLWGFLSHKT